MRYTPYPSRSRGARRSDVYSRAMIGTSAPASRRLDPRKFQDPLVTATGEARAQVALKALQTLWFNTGSLCNLTCHNC